MSDTDSAFGTFRCTASGFSHYFLPGKSRPLCGARQEPGGEAITPSGAVFRQRACPECVELNVERWRLAGGQAK